MREYPDTSGADLGASFGGIGKGADRLILGAVLLILAGFYLWYQPTKLAHYTDPLIYLSGAESLAQGNGYRWTAYADAPRISCHPPLQSALLSVFWRFYPAFPENIRLLYGVMILSALVTFSLFFRYCRKNGMPPLVAGLLIILWGLSLHWGALIYSFMSDVTFGLLWLILASRWQDAKDPDSPSHWWWMGVIASLMYLAREAALAVVVVLAAMAAWRAWKLGRIKLLVFYLGPVLPAVALWKLWSANFPGYGTYIGSRVAEEGGLTSTIRYCVDTAQFYLMGIGFNRSLFSALMDSPSSNVVSGSSWSPILTGCTVALCLLLTLLWVGGCWRSKTLQSRVCGVLVAAYLAELCIYPANLGERVLYAVLPLVLVWAWKGRELLPKAFLARRSLSWAVVLFLGLNVAANARSFAQAMNYLDSCSHLEELQEVGSWLRQNSPPEAVVALTMLEPVMHFHHYSGRKVIENYFEVRPSTFFPSTSRQANFLLIDWYSPFRLEDLNVRTFHLAKASAQGRYRLYRVGPDGSEIPHVAEITD